MDSFEFFATPAAATSMIMACALVLLMTLALPGLYRVLVHSKNALHAKRMELVDNLRRGIRVIVEDAATVPPALAAAT